MVEETIAINVIRDARQKDRTAMNEMVQKFQPVLFYIASCHLKDPELIRHTVKDCLRKLFDCLDETENLSSFNGRAMNMIVRTCLNAALLEDEQQLSFAAAGSDPTEQSAVYTDADEQPLKESSFTEKEAMNIVVKILRKLPDDQRMVFVMRYLDGMSFSRISTMIHVPEETLKKRAQLAKNALSAYTSRTVGGVFGIISLAEQNKYLILEEEAPGDVFSLRKDTAAQEITPAESVPASAASKPQRRKKILLVSGISAAIVLLAGGAGILRRPKQVSFLPYAAASFTGVNGGGSALITIGETGNPKLDRIIESSECTLKDSAGNDVQEGHLSNGDVLTYACRVDEDALKKARLILRETQVDVTVNGLAEPEQIDLFHDVYLAVETDEESGEARLVADSSDPGYDEVKYSVVEEGEDGILVYAEIPDETLLSYGYVTDSHYRLFTEDEIPAELQSAVRRIIVENGLEQAAPHFDEYGFEIANGSDPKINELAQSYIGRGGACNEIANAFIYDLYGVRVHTGYSRENTYEVDSPEPGDLIYYYDNNGNYSHVATYIGNGLVLNGNYGDGRAHITSMYESWYAGNPMTFLRVQR